MDVGKFLSQEQVLVNLRAPDKSTLLRELATRAAATLGVPAERISSELIKREQLGSTGTGGGVAIPHARVREVERPFGMFVRLSQPIDFEAVDGLQVDIVFMLLLPADAAGEQLAALATVARRLRESERLGQLRRLKKAEDLYRTFAK